MSASTAVAIDTAVFCLLHAAGACDGNVPCCIAGWLLRGANVGEQKLVRALEDEVANKILSSKVLRTSDAAETIGTRAL